MEANDYPTPWPREDVINTPPQFESARMSIHEQAEVFASRHASHTREMIATYEKEITRLEELLQDYRDGVKILTESLGNYPVDGNSISV